MDLFYLFRLLKKKMWILIIIPLIISGVGFYIAFTSDYKFKSSAQLATSITTKDNIRITEEGFNFREVQIKFSNLIESMTSDQVVTLVSYDLILHDLDSIRPFTTIEPEERKSTWHGDEVALEKAKATIKEKLAKMEVLSNFNDYDRELSVLLKDYGYDHIAIKKNLKVSRLDFTDYILVSYETDNPYLAAYVVNKLCEEFIRFNVDYSAQRSDESVNFFLDLVNQKKVELDEKSDRLKNFKSTNKFFDVDLESQAQLGQISELETKEEELTNNVHSLQLSIYNLKERINFARNSGSGSTTSNAGNIRILNLRKQIQGLNEQYIVGGRSDQKLLDSLSTLRAQLQIESEKLNNAATAVETESVADLNVQLDKMEVDLQIAKSALSSTQSRLRYSKYKKSDFASKEAVIADLEREVSVASQEYLDAQSKYNETRNKALASGNALRQIMAGQPAAEPESRKVVIITVFSWLTSFSICVFFIVLLEYFDLSIKTPERFESLTKLKYLGSVNMLKAKNPDPQELFNKSNNVESENFKHLVRKLRYELEESGSKKFLITSTRKGDGKSFLISTLAYSMSLIHKKVLIVDTNFKNNHLSGLVANPKSKALLENESVQLIVRNSDNLEDESFKGIVSPTPYKNIDVIASVVSPLSPSEILMERDFKSLLDILSERYDYIFLESAAMNEHSDTKELVGYVDKVIPVFAADEVIQQKDKESIVFLNTLGDRLFGSVLNKLDIKDLDI